MECSCILGFVLPEGRILRWLYTYFRYFGFLLMNTRSWKFSSPVFCQWLHEMILFEVWHVKWFRTKEAVLSRANWDYCMCWWYGTCINNPFISSFLLLYSWLRARNWKVTIQETSFFRWVYVGGICHISISTWIGWFFAYGFNYIN